MPLIIIVGIPCSGKTTRAKELEEHFKSLNKKVVRISDDDLFEDKNEAYKNSYNEKETRATVKSNCAREISKDVIVILDSLNYIKGFRYELHCLSRNSKTTHCVVYCDTPVETAKEWNAKSEKKYDEKLLEELASRMEVPIGTNRWDKPLFVVKPEDKTPIEAISQAVLSGKQLTAQHLPSLPTRLSDTKALYLLDKVANDIINTIMERQKTSMPGDLIPIEGSDVKFKMTPRLTLKELRRLRSQFLKINQLHPPTNSSEIPKMFVMYLNENLK